MARNILCKDYESEGIKRYADHPLLGDTTDWGGFRPITARNRSVTVDFDHCRLLPGSISQGRRGRREEEIEEEGEPGDLVPLFLDDPDRSPPSFTEMLPPPRLKRLLLLIRAGRRSLDVTRKVSSPHTITNVAGFAQGGTSSRARRRGVASFLREDKRSRLFRHGKTRFRQYRPVAGGPYKGILSDRYVPLVSGGIARNRKPGFCLSRAAPSHVRP
ncbi:hypothetical protein GW17_00039352 [Ensete ventricosum]|nr:hypothetical protein GW17_00039352 [Ensete ventricosum]